MLTWGRLAECLAVVYVTHIDGEACDILESLHEKARAVTVSHCAYQAGAPRCVINSGDHALQKVMCAARPYVTRDPHFFHISD